MSRFFRSSKNNTESRSERLMNGVALWASYYRYFPHIFVKEYLGINLKIFQQILIYFMMHFNYFMYIASRGQGKTWLTAVFCIVRAILYPETKIIVSAAVIKQGIEVIEKIEEMRQNSYNLAREIRELKTTSNDPRIEFWNGSWIKVVTSTDNARSKRANLLIVDEFRMVDLDIINKVLRKFLTAPRYPKYLNKPEYKHLQERNKEIYLSSAWFKNHWSWKKFLAYFNSMAKDKQYFVCGLPYQLSVSEGLLMREQVLDEMSEDDFNLMSWQIEMECLFFGENENSFFKFDDLHRSRVLKQPVYPRPFYGQLKDKAHVYPEKQRDEIRFISADIAGIAGKANDASAYTVFRLLPNKRGYDRHIVYMESIIGGHTVTQALRIKQLFHDFDCDYLVLDTQGIGLGVYDQLVQPLFDKERNMEYEAWTCMNDEKMASRCVVPNSPEVIYSIKGSSQLNNDVAIGLKDAYRRNKIKMLIDENIGRQELLEHKGYSNLSAEEQMKYELPYRQITALINEMVNLEGVANNGLVKLQEPRNGRKDRYSSVGYGNYFANELERKYLTQEREFDWGSYALW